MSQNPRSEGNPRPVYRVPVLLRTAGLAQTLAFLVSRRDTQSKLLAGHLAEQLDLKDPMEVLSKGTTEYLRLSHDALALADWYVRHVQACFPEVDRTEGDRG